MPFPSGVATAPFTVTDLIPAGSVAVHLTVMLALLTTDDVGEVIFTTGNVVSRVAAYSILVCLPVVSVTMTVMTLEPGVSVTGMVKSPAGPGVTGVPLTVTEPTPFVPGVTVPVTVVVVGPTSGGVVMAIIVAAGSNVMFCTTMLCLSAASVAVIVTTLFPAVKVTGALAVNTPPAPMVVVTVVPLTVTVTV